MVRYDEKLTLVFEPHGYGTATARNYPTAAEASALHLNYPLFLQKGTAAARITPFLPGTSGTPVSIKLAPSPSGYTPAIPDGCTVPVVYRLTGASGENIASGTYRGTSREAATVGRARWSRDPRHPHGRRCTEQLRVQRTRHAQPSFRTVHIPRLRQPPLKPRTPIVPVLRPAAAGRTGLYSRTARTSIGATDGPMDDPRHAVALSSLRGLRKRWMDAPHPCGAPFGPPKLDQEHNPGRSRLRSGKRSRIAHATRPRRERRPEFAKLPG